MLFHILFSKGLSYSNKDVATALAEEFHSDRVRGMVTKLVKRERKTPEELIKVCAYAVRVMMSHVREKYPCYVELQDKMQIKTMVGSNAHPFGLRELYTLVAARIFEMSEDDDGDVDGQTHNAPSVSDDASPSMKMVANPFQFLGYAGSSDSQDVSVAPFADSSAGTPAEPTKLCTRVSGRVLATTTFALLIRVCMAMAGEQHVKVQRKSKYACFRKGEIGHG